MKKPFRIRQRRLSKTSTNLKKEIRSHREVKDAFEDSERRYQTLIELAEEGIWTVGPDANTTFVNRKMSEILGYTPEEMLGKSLFSCVSARDKGYLEEKFSRIKKGHNEHFELVFLKKDQAPAYTGVSASPRIDEHGIFNYGLFVVSDVTALKKARRTLSGKVKSTTAPSSKRLPMASLSWTSTASSHWEIFRLRRCWGTRPRMN